MHGDVNGEIMQGAGELMVPFASLLLKDGQGSRVGDQSIEMVPREVTHLKAVAMEVHRQSGQPCPVSYSNIPVISHDTIQLKIMYVYTRCFKVLEQGTGTENHMHACI